MEQSQNEPHNSRNFKTGNSNRKNGDSRMKSGNQELTRSNQLLRSFLSVHKNLIRLFHKTAIDNGLTLPQYSILMTMAPLKKTTQKKLGEITFMPKSTLSQSVERLVKAGLIHRQQVEGNRREMQLALSQKGEALIQSMRHQEGGILQVFKSACETLTEEQFQELIKAHVQIVTYLESQAIEQGECTK